MQKTGCTNGVSPLLLQFNNLSLSPIQSPGRSPRYPPSQRECLPGSEAICLAASVQYVFDDEQMTRHTRQIPPTIMIQSVLTDDVVLHANTEFNVVIEKTSDSATFFLKFANPLTQREQLENGQKAQFDASIKRFFELVGKDGICGHKFHVLLCAEVIQSISREYFTLLQNNVIPYAVKIIYRHSTYIPYTTDVHEKLMGLLLHAHKVEQLDFSDCGNITALDLNNLLTVTPKGCTELTLDNCRWFQDTDMQQLVKTPHFGLLHSISLSGCTKLTDQGFCTLFANNRGIVKLSANRCFIQHRFFKFLNSIRYTSLNYLSLEECTITQKMVKALSQTHYRLIELNLLWCAVLPQWITEMQQKHAKIQLSQRQFQRQFQGHFQEQSCHLTKPTHIGPSDEMLQRQMSFLATLREQKWCSASHLAAYLSKLLGITEVVSDGQWFSFVLKEVVTTDCEHPILSEEILHYFKAYKIALTIGYAALTHSSKTMVGHFLRELAPHCKRVVFTPGRHLLGNALEPVDFSEVIEFQASHTEIDGAHFQLLKFKNLEYLVLRNCVHVTSLFQYLSFQLKELDIRKCSLGDNEVMLALQKVYIHTLVRFTVADAAFQTITEHDDLVRLIVNLTRMQKIQYTGSIRTLAQKLKISEQNYVLLGDLANRYDIEKLRLELDVWFRMNNFQNYFTVHWINGGIHISLQPLSKLIAMPQNVWTFLTSFTKMPLVMSLNDDLESDNDQRDILLRTIFSQLGSSVEEIYYQSRTKYTLHAEVCSWLKAIKKITFLKSPNIDNLLHVFLHNCVNLESLSIECTNLTGNDIAQILQRFKNITKLYLLDGSRLGVGDLEVILRAANHLVVLDLSNCKKLTDQILQKHLLQMTNLQVLNLAGCNSITDQAFLGATFTSLVLLDLSYTNITDAGLQNIVFNSPGLKVLKVSGTKVSLKNISLPVLLEEVNVQNCSAIDDQSVMHIAAKLAVLRRLDLTCCQSVSEKSIACLVRICPQVETVVVNNCPKICREVSLFLQPKSMYVSTLDLTGKTRYSFDQLEIIIRRGVGIRHLQASYNASLDLRYLEDVCKIFYERKGKRLKILELINCHEDPVVVLVGSPAQYLVFVKSLHLSGKITARTLNNLADYKGLTSLQVVSSHTDSTSCITDDVLAKLARDLSSLQSVHLEKLHFITHAGIRQMVQSNRMLKGITIQDCQKVTNAEIQALQREYQHVKFQFCSNIY